MARRVNTKFVVIMCAAVAAAAGGVFGLKIYRNHKAQDPVALKQKADAEEKAGDLKKAAGYLAQAAAFAAKKHMMGADEMYAHTADLCMTISKSAKSDDDAIEY